jgi:hypothetical protein
MLGKAEGAVGKVLAMAEKGGGLRDSAIPGCLTPSAPNLQAKRCNAIRWHQPVPNHMP